MEPRHCNEDSMLNNVSETMYTALRKHLDRAKLTENPLTSDSPLWIPMQRVMADLGLHFFPAFI